MNKEFITTQMNANNSFVFIMRIRDINYISLKDFTKFIHQLINIKITVYV